MAVISLSITESSLQLVAGIPRYITIEANIPCTIFYTLDGTDPDTSSEVYLSSLNLPTNASTVQLKIWASNGLNSSVITELLYQSDLTVARQPHDKVLNAPQTQQTYDRFPYGSVGLGPLPEFGNTAGITVNAPGVADISDGYDADGNPTPGTDLPLENYSFIYSTSNWKGERGRGIGTLPAQVTVRPSNTSPPLFSNTNSKTFDPRALVIYQDASEEVAEPNVPQVNKQYFSKVNNETARDGTYLSLTAYEGNQISGSFINSHVNPNDGTITYYYRDSLTGQWIISKQPYSPGDSNPGLGLADMIYSERYGSRVFLARPFHRRSY